MALTFDNKVKLAEELEKVASSIRNRRLVVIDQWLKIHNAWKGSYTRSFFHSDIFNHYVPYFRRIVESFTVRATQMVLPQTEFFDVFPADEGEDANSKEAAAVRSFLMYILKKRIKIGSVVKQLFRCSVLYGRKIVKTGVRVVHEDGRDTVWPTMRAVDPFMFWHWPEVISDIDDAIIVGEDAFISYEQYKSEADQGRTDQIAQSDLVEPTWPTHVTQRLQTSGLPDSKSEISDGSKKQTDWVYRSEIWCRVPNGWKFVWIVWNHKDGPKVVKVSAKVFPRPQYRMSISREIPGEQYTSSIGYDEEPLQILLNDQVNMYFEGQAMQLGPPTAVDINLIQRHGTLAFRPRAKWLIPPEGVKTIVTPDITKPAIQGISFATGLMDKFGGSSPMAEGQTVRNMPRAGFAVSSLLSMSLADIRDEAKSLEDEILTPSLFDIYALTMDFVPTSQVFKVPGTTNFPQARKITKKEIQGNFDFNWIGSLQTQENQTRADKLTNLMDVVGRFGQFIIADLQARGKRVNWTLLLETVWRDTVGERGLHKIVEDVQPGEPQNNLPPDLTRAQVLPGLLGGGQEEGVEE